MFCTVPKGVCPVHIHMLKFYLAPSVSTLALSLAFSRDDITASRPDSNGRANWHVFVTSSPYLPQTGLGVDDGVGGMWVDVAFTQRTKEGQQHNIALTKRTIFIANGVGANEIRLRNDAITFVCGCGNLQATFGRC